MKIYKQYFAITKEGFPDESVPFFALNSLEHEITVAFCDIFLYNNVRVAQKQIEKRKAG